MFDRTQMAIDAARDGIGIPLETNLTMWKELADGRLVCPVSSLPMLTLTTQWVVCPVCDYLLGGWICLHLVFASARELSEPLFLLECFDYGAAGGERILEVHRERQSDITPQSGHDQHRIAFRFARFLRV